MHFSVWAPCNGRRGTTKLGAKSRCSFTAACKLHEIPLLNCCLVLQKQEYIANSQSAATLFSKPLITYLGKLVFFTLRKVSDKIWILVLLTSWCWYLALATSPLSVTTEKKVRLTLKQESFYKHCTQNVRGWTAIGSTLTCLIVGSCILGAAEEFWGRMAVLHEHADQRDDTK